MPEPRPLRSTDPREIGGHRLTARLGEGAQGTVFLGESGDGERVAVKLLHGDVALDARTRTNFERELATARRVAPFCTARVIAAEVDADPPYIVSEYIEGPSLKELVAGRGALPGDELVRLAIGTATALAAIHEAGVVHRDLKPANVLLGPDGPRVIDFGIARLLDATSATLTEAVGTPAFMAPEQVAGAAGGPPLDMFAWGCTMAYAANRVPPFAAASVAAIMHRVLHGEPDLGVLGGELRGLVAAALAKDPAARPTALQVLSALLGDGTADLLAEGTSAAAPLTGSSFVPVPAPLPDAPAAPGAPGAPAAWPPPVPPVPAGAGTAAGGQAGWLWGPPETVPRTPYPLPPTYPGTTPPRRRSPLIAAAAGGAVLLAAAVTAVIILQSDGEAGGGRTTSGTSPLNTASATAGACSYTPTSPDAADLVKDVGTPPATPQARGPVTATLTTTLGEITMRLDAAKAPCTVNSLMYLAGRRFFDSTSCHRLTTSPQLSVLQCGDPTGRGSGGPAYRFADENGQDHRYTRGTVAMANSGADTNGSQFFIVYKDVPALSSPYTIFGTVTSGMDIVDKVARAGTEDAKGGGEGDGRPKLKITITALRTSV